MSDTLNPVPSGVCVSECSARTHDGEGEYVCTLPLGHGGAHEAHATLRNTDLRCRWSDDDAPSETPA